MLHLQKAGEHGTTKTDVPVGTQAGYHLVIPVSVTTDSMRSIGVAS